MRPTITYAHDPCQNPRAAISRQAWMAARTEVEVTLGIRLRDIGAGELDGLAPRSAGLDFEGELVVADGDLVAVGERGAGTDARAFGRARRWLTPSQ
jgi:hypothetical protein